MRRILGLFIVMMFLFGCLGPGPEPENVTDDTIGNVTVTTTPQENQTVTPGNGVVVNGDGPEEPVVARGMNYTLDENANIILYFIHTGQPELVHGEAILLKKGDFDMLIDAGPAESSGIVVNFLESKQVDDIEVLLSTTADPMRYGGMENIISSFEVEEFWWSGNCFTDSEYCGIVDSLSETSNVIEVERGYERRLQGVDFSVLNPKEPAFNHPDNDAVVLRVEDREFAALLTSNILIGSQSELVNNKENEIKVQVMSAPYYGVGRGTNNIGIFLINAEPEHIIISGSSDDSAEAGGSREPLFRLMLQYGINSTATYEKGDIRLVSDGHEYAITTVE